MPVADLHVHTTNSDGTMTLAEVPRAARRADLEVVAITDHDRLHPELAHPIARVDGVTLLHGIELRVETGDQRVDLLGYGVRPTPDLLEEIDRLQENRVERGRAIIERVEDRLGVDLPVEAREGIGRVHIAEAIDESSADYDFQGAFDELIGDGRPCFVARELTSFDRATTLLGEACGLVALAHPLRYDDPEAALERAAVLDGVERYYPYDREVDTALVERAAERHDLVVTGGSDAHDDVLGTCGLSRSAYRTFRARFSTDALP